MNITVKELIKTLHIYNPKLKVWLRNGLDGEYRPLRGMNDNFSKKKDDNKYYIETLELKYLTPDLIKAGYDEKTVDENGEQILVIFP